MSLNEKIHSTAPGSGPVPGPATVPAPPAVTATAAEVTGNGSPANEDSTSESRQEDVPKEVCVPVNPSADNVEAISNTVRTNQDTSESNKEEKSIGAFQEKKIAHVAAAKNTNANAQMPGFHEETKVREDVKSKQVSIIAPQMYRNDVHRSVILNRKVPSFYRELPVHENLPSTWVVHVHKRLNGARQFDAYWFTTAGKKLRSKPEVMKFLTYLRDTKGDEEIAWTRLKKGVPFESSLMSFDIGRPLVKLISELRPDTSSAVKKRTKKVAQPKAAKAGKTNAKVAKPTKAKMKGSKSEKKRKNGEKKKSSFMAPVTNSVRYQRLNKVKQIKMNRDKYRVAEAKTSGEIVTNFERKRSAKAARKFPLRTVDVAIPSVAESKYSK